MSKKRTTKRAGAKATFEAFECWAPASLDTGKIRTHPALLRPARPKDQGECGDRTTYVRVRITPADAPDYERVVRGIDRLRRWVAKELKECKKLGVPCSISGESMLEELTRLTAAQRQKGGE
jgi:hypothetical protein